MLPMIRSKGPPAPLLLLDLLLALLPLRMAKLLLGRLLEPLWRVAVA